MTETILANATLVLPDETVTGSVVFRDGRIAEIGGGATVPKGAIDCEGDYLMPGLIELHTDNLERHIQPRPKVDWPHAAAIVAHDAELASTGITTVFDALRVGSILSSKKNTYGKYARKLASEILGMRDKGGLRISHFLHLRAEVCSETLTEELAEFTEADRIGIVSLMDHVPGQRQWRDMPTYKAFLTGKYGLSESDFELHVNNIRGIHARLGAAHEKAAVREAKRLGAVLASHDDTTEGHVETSATNGVRIAEFPTTVEAARACRAKGIYVMMGAPNLVRGGSHSGNVAAQELAEDGCLDILSSDYIPAALLTSALQLGRLWDDIPRGIRTVTANPAQATGLDDRGRIEIGARGDVIRVGRGIGAAATRGVWVQGARVG